MTRVICCLLVLALAGGSLYGQAGARKFEVASIKPHVEPPHIMGVQVSGSRLTADAETVRGLVMWAYNLKNWQVSGPGNPDPVGDTFYDVVAKAEGETPPTREQFREMLQTLLADRFQLKIHKEQREMPVYALILGKNGTKMKESAPDAATGGRMQVVDRNYQITIPRAGMSEVVDAVANAFLDRPVVDRTGLTGSYDLKLVYTPETRANRMSEPSTSDVTIFTAVQEQLGLKLEPQKAMVDILVIDRVEKPTEN